LAGGQTGSGYNFAEVPMVDPLGSVFVDVNSNGILDSGEPGVAGVTITLTGSDIFNQTISRSTQTDGSGSYRFAGLAPGIYSIIETPPVGFIDGRPQNGSPPAAMVAPHQFIGIDLTRAPFFGSGYNFGELLSGFVSAVAFAVPVGMPSVDPTFVSKVQLFGSVMADDAAGSTAFVNSLYHQVLGRAPDQDGLNHWVYEVDAGLSRTQVADSFWRSSEHRGLQVDAFYQSLLHRASDPASRSFWINRFLSGATEADVAADLLTSGEYQASQPGQVHEKIATDMPFGATTTT
jgi:hypothetical protein